MRYWILFLALVASAFADPLQPMIRLNRDDTVSRLCASGDITAVASSRMEPYDPAKSIKMEPETHVSLFKGTELVAQFSLGDGGIRALIATDSDFVAAKVSFDQQAHEEARFFLVRSNGSLEKIPPLRITLVGLLENGRGGLIAYGSREVWELNLQDKESRWHQVPISGRVIQKPIRAIVSCGVTRYAIVTSEVIIGLESLSGEPTWMVPYQGQFVSAVAKNKCWILTSEETGAKIGYVDEAKGVVAFVGEIPNRAAQGLFSVRNELFVFTSGRGSKNAERSYFIFDMKDQKLKESKTLPNRTTSVYTTDDRLIFATNVGEIYEQRIP